MQNSKLIHQTLLKSIRFYQRTLSPDHGLARVLFPGGVCRYEQTCSEYTYQAVAQYGLSGLWLGIKRLASCHPFTKV